MGARPGEAAALTGSFVDWLDAQFVQPHNAVDMAGLNAAGGSNTPGNRNNLMRMAVFSRWCSDPAQLRLRVAHVLSQIVVCAPSPSDWSNEYDSGLWWNEMVSRAFSNYRSILQLAITHRHMGKYLNNLNNYASNGTAPSQNFARELLQLFSMGVVALNRDGSVVKDAAGNPVKAYQLSDVDALARMLAGWNLPFANNFPGRDGSYANGVMNVSPALAYNGPAVTLFGTTFPQVAVPRVSTIMSRMNACLDLIMAQPTTAAYISKQFIKKLVTDTPSPEYVTRVTSVFENNGEGVRGDLKAIVTAVLLDPEARGNSKPVTFGRAQEWTLSVTKAMRYAEMEPLGDAWTSRSLAWGWVSDLGEMNVNVLARMGQSPTVPGSVFNDYPFEYKVDGVEAPASALWQSPSILANVAFVLPWSARLAQPLASAPGDWTGRWNLTWHIDLYDRVSTSTLGTPAQKQTAAVTALVNQVNSDLNQGRPISALARQQTISFIDIDCAAMPKREKIAWMINFIRCLPDSAVVI